MSSYSVTALNKDGDAVQLDTGINWLRNAYRVAKAYADQGFKCEVRLDNLLLDTIEPKALDTFDGSEGR